MAARGAHSALWPHHPGGRGARDPPTQLQRCLMGGRRLCGRTIVGDRQGSRRRRCTTRAVANGEVSNGNQGVTWLLASGARRWRMLLGQPGNLRIAFPRLRRVPGHTAVIRCSCTALDRDHKHKCNQAGRCDGEHLRDHVISSLLEEHGFAGWRGPYAGRFLVVFPFQHLEGNQRPDAGQGHEGQEYEDGIGG